MNHTHQYHVVGVGQGFHSIVDGSLGYSSFHFPIFLRSRCPNSTKQNICQRSVHRYTLHMNRFSQESTDWLCNFLTMIYERIDPLTPIRDPTVVNNGLSSMKPA